MLAEAYPGDPGELQRVIVHVPDRPGVLAGITQALGAERINIEDFELRHFSPERGGVLTILVSGEDEAGARGVAARGAGLRRLGLAGPRMKIEPAASVQGGLAVPGDKSISHRAVLIGAIADGETVIEGFGRSADTESTIACGARARRRGGGGRRHRARDGRRPARPPRAGRRDRLRQRRHARAPRRRASSPARTGKRFELTGDESLSTRPMERIAEPLEAMGAGGARRPTARLPLRIDGAALRGLDYELPVASAQVKSCVLLAGLYAAGPTTVVEPVADPRPHRADAARRRGARADEAGLGRDLGRSSGSTRCA